MIITRLLCGLLVICFSVATGIAAQTGTGNNVLILPAENLSGVPEAESELASLLARKIVSSGWNVLPTDGLEERLESDRIRYFDSLGAETRGKLATETGASVILTSTIYFYDEKPVPSVALSARLVTVDDVVLWGDVAALTPAETEGVLGFGRRDTRPGVASLAVDSLMRRFPKPGVNRGVVRGCDGPLLASSPRRFSAADLATSAHKRVFVLPFESFARESESARMVADIATLRFAAAKGLVVVSPAELREAALAANIASFRGISSRDLIRLSEALGTKYAISGTIYSFGDPNSRMATPEIDLEMLLTDVATGRTLWMAQTEKEGSDYAGFLLRGAAKNAVSLTDRVVSDMIADVNWTDPRVDDGTIAEPIERRLRARREQLVTMKSGDH